MLTVQLALSAAPCFSPPYAGRGRLLLLLAGIWICGGCTTIRVVDSPRTADLDFLLTGAAEKAVLQLSTDSLRDREVFLDTQYLVPTLQPSANFHLENELSRQPSLEHLFLIGEVRAKLLKSGVRLVDSKQKAQVVLELRAGALSTNHLEYLLGIPSSAVPVSAVGVGPSASVPTPELSIIKSTKQYGWASVSFVAYWADTGELLSVSGPFTGKTYREDYWLFGAGPNTRGDIPSANQ
jgi:hypothetical protein